MGYSLTIGEAVIETSDERIKIAAKGAHLPEAPAFGEPTDHTSARWPSYTAWHDFARAAGIHELFYGQGWDRDLRGYRECSEGFHREGGMLAEHPGAALITKADADYVSAARAKFIADHPGVISGFADDAVEMDPRATLARLEWLDFWFRWAVENCANPVLENT